MKKLFISARQKNVTINSIGIAVPGGVYPDSGHFDGLVVGSSFLSRRGHHRRGPERCSCSRSTPTSSGDPADQRSESHACPDSPGATMRDAPPAGISLRILRGRTWHASSRVRGRVRTGLRPGGLLWQPVPRRGDRPRESRSRSLSFLDRTGDKALSAAPLLLPAKTVITSNRWQASEASGTSQRSSTRTISISYTTLTGPTRASASKSMRRRSTLMMQRD